MRGLLDCGLSLYYLFSWARNCGFDSGLQEGPVPGKKIIIAWNGKRRRWMPSEEIIT